jgi:hypothetical protein
LLNKNFFRFVTAAAGVIMLLGAVSPAFAQGLSPRDDAGKRPSFNGTVNAPDPDVNEQFVPVDGDGRRGFVVGQYGVGLVGTQPANNEIDPQRQFSRAVGNPATVTTPAVTNTFVYPYVIPRRDRDY